MKKSYIWRRTQAIITDKRIIDIHQRKLFDVTVSEAGFYQVEDVAFRKKGVLQNFFDWYFNVFLVTDERIIDIDFYSLIYKRVSAAKIRDLEDVTFSQVGAVRALFDYGTVYMQTAGAKVEFEFEEVPHPRKVAAFVNEMYLEEEQEEIEHRVR